MKLEAEIRAEMQKAKVLRQRTLDRMLAMGMTPDQVTAAMVAGTVETTEVTLVEETAGI